MFALGQKVANTFFTRKPRPSFLFPHRIPSIPSNKSSCSNFLISGPSKIPSSTFSYDTFGDLVTKYCKQSPSFPRDLLNCFITPSLACTWGDSIFLRSTSVTFIMFFQLGWIVFPFAPVCLLPNATLWLDYDIHKRNTAFLHSRILDQVTHLLLLLNPHTFSKNIFRSEHILTCSYVSLTWTGCPSFGPHNKYPPPTWILTDDTTNAQSHNNKPVSRLLL